MLVPRQPAPGLALPTLDHGQFDLGRETSTWGTLLVFYRGLHCPICAGYLTELERLVPEFEKRGVGVVAVSSDAQDRARGMADKVKASNLRFAHDLALSTAQEWGLMISTSRGKTSIGIEEPKLFSEPGLFLVRADGTVYFGNVQTMPFMRPHFKELPAALDFVQGNDYPARGEYTGPV